jgi:pimeloyl-ACP methyl ester carboxylesterase
LFCFPSLPFDSSEQGLSLLKPSYVYLSFYLCQFESSYLFQENQIATSPTPKVLEGEIDFQVPAAGKSCRLIVGDLLSGKRPLIALHGGPGVGSDYLFVYANMITVLYVIPVILYDQLGTGRSTHLPEKLGDASFWTTQLFLDELDNLLIHFKINNDYDLLGHSWGGMLAA